MGCFLLVTVEFKKYAQWYVSYSLNAGFPTLQYRILESDVEHKQCENRAKDSAHQNSSHPETERFFSLRMKVINETE